MKKYISLEIYKPSFGDCSNGGLSSKYSNCYIECERGWIDEDKILDDAIVKLEKGAFGTIHLVPTKPIEKNCVGYMMGGCYVASSDSRFHELIKKTFGIDFYGAIALHDRTETYEDYELLSR